MHTFILCTQSKLETISKKHFNLGIKKDFALDTKEELIKILESTNHAKDLTLCKNSYFK